MKPLCSKIVRSGFLVITLLAIFVFAGCRSVRRDEALVGPLRTTDPEIERGRLVLAQRCDTCHPGGAGGVGPALNDKPFPRFLMKTQVRLGLGAMPGFDKHEIAPEDLDALMKYVVALRRHDEIRDTAKIQRQ
jgi:mono/diheme cytochrome c family protein